MNSKTFNFNFKYLQPIAVIYYFIIYMLFLSGDRDLSSLPWIVLYSFSLDTVLKYLSKKKWEFSLPGITTGIATVLLIRTPGYLWPYYFAISVGLLTKQLFKDTEGHYFNPAAIGIYIGICLFPEYSHIHLAQWALKLPFYLSFLVIALTVSFLNKKLTLSLSYLIPILLLRATWTLISGESMSYSLGAIASMITLIFAFHMITDPKTSPRSIKGQILFGLMIAIFDFILRIMDIPFSAILALCLVSAIINPLRNKLPAFQITERRPV